MEKISYELEGTMYQQLDSIKRISLPDSFVSIPQKLNKGNGEAKLYVGNESDEIRNFFGPRPFRIKCFFNRSELFEFMQELKLEYKYPKQQYRRKNELTELFDKRLSKINDQNEIIWFSFNEQEQIAPPRIYGKSDDFGYKFLRELPLPRISFLSFIKLQSSSRTIFHARLSTDFSPLEIKQFLSDI